MVENKITTPIQVTKTYLPDVDKYKSYVDRIFSSGWVTNHGALVNLLEDRLRKYLSINNVLLVANGTLALQIAYKTLGLQGAVVTTPFSFVATTSSLVWEGLKPKFADIDPESFCLDPENIEKNISSEVSAILPVHIFGNCCEIDKISAIASRHGLNTVYDASHAFGVRYRERSVFDFGDISIVSFHATKIFHTVEGGALIVPDDHLYEKAKYMRDFGITGPDCVGSLGINAKMNEFEAAMGLCVLDDIEMLLEARKNLYAYYLEKLPSTLKVQKMNRLCVPNYSYFPVVFSSEGELVKVERTLNSRNIFPRRYFSPSLDTLPYLNGHQKMPVSNAVSKTILCLPLFFGMDFDVVDLVAETISGVLNA